MTNYTKIDVVDESSRAVRRFFFARAFQVYFLKQEGRRYLIFVYYESGEMLEVIEST